MEFTYREMEILEEAMWNRCSILKDIMDNEPNNVLKHRIEKLWVEATNLLTRIARRDRTIAHFSEE